MRTCCVPRVSSASKFHSTAVAPERACSLAGASLPFVDTHAALGRSLGLGHPPLLFAVHCLRAPRVMRPPGSQLARWFAGSAGFLVRRALRSPASCWVSSPLGSASLSVVSPWSLLPSPFFLCAEWSLFGIGPRLCARPRVGPRAGPPGVCVGRPRAHPRAARVSLRLRRGTLVASPWARCFAIGRVSFLPLFCASPASRDAQPPGWWVAVASQSPLPSWALAAVPVSPSRRRACLLAVRRPRVSAALPASSAFSLSARLPLA